MRIMTAGTALAGEREEDAAPAIASEGAGVEAFLATIEARLDALVPPAGDRYGLAASIRYALLAPGKRLRPLLALAAAAQAGAVGNAVPRALDTSCAIEMVHAASLILDDLPCMDDAAIRRGRPASHLAFGEDAAILTAIALLSLAFGTIARDASLGPADRALLVALLSEAVGPSGLVAGQIGDLRLDAASATQHDIEAMHRDKTAALYRVAAEAGVIAAGGGAAERAAAARLGERIGLAFQALDDLKDRALSSEEAGKDTLKDGDKPSLIAVLGPPAAARALREHIAAARVSADAIGDGTDAGRAPLRAFLDACFPAGLVARVSE